MQTDRAAGFIHHADRRRGRFLRRTREVAEGFPGIAARVVGLSLCAFQFVAAIDVALGLGGIDPKKAALDPERDRAAEAGVEVERLLAAAPLLRAKTGFLLTRTRDLDVAADGADRPEGGIDPVVRRAGRGVNGEGAAAPAPVPASPLALFDLDQRHSLERVGHEKGVIAMPDRKFQSDPFFGLLDNPLRGTQGRCSGR